jgi:multimeric flavodoxin WrbA
MKVIAISGSRNRQGKTAQIVDAVLKGVNAAGGQSESIFLTERKLEHCRQCNPDGWGICRAEGRCIIEDDFASIVEKINAADAVVFANPTYFADLSDSMKMFLDRLRRVSFMKTLQRPRLPGGFAATPGKPAIGICFAGGSGGGSVSALFNLERVLLTCGFESTDMISIRRQNLDMKLPMLEKVGEWLVNRPAAPPPAPAH